VLSGRNSHPPSPGFRRQTPEVFPQRQRIGLRADHGGETDFLFPQPLPQAFQFAGLPAESVTFRLRSLFGEMQKNKSLSRFFKQAQRFPAPFLPGTAAQRGGQRPGAGKANILPPRPAVYKHVAAAFPEIRKQGEAFPFIQMRQGTAQGRRKNGPLPPCGAGFGKIVQSRPTKNFLFRGGVGRQKMRRRTAAQIQTQPDKGIADSACGAISGS
jgi:hypothetical protein